MSLTCNLDHSAVVEMGRDPTRPELTSDPQLIRGRPGFDPGNFLTQSDRTNIEKIAFLRKIFKTQPKQ